jgi:hypothetical protein
MRPLTPPNIESELSYAYLHAVASHAGMSCVVGTRHEDNNGIDATVTAWGPFEDGGYLSEVSLRVQLKATTTELLSKEGNFSYFLKGVARYDDLRTPTVSIARILLVLFLPPDAEMWLEHSSQRLALRRCAYWQSLRGAPPTTNESGVTVKLPIAQEFNAQALRRLVARLSRLDFPGYPAS